MILVLSVMVAVIGMSMAIGGGLATGSRLVGWGLAIFMGSLVAAFYRLQKQIDELKADKSKKSQTTPQDIQQTQDVQPSVPGDA